MKSVLTSVHPKWCELIANGEKTIEVHKTRPAAAPPFKCYIYETKARSDMPTFVDEDGHVLYTGRGQVIGETICDKLIYVEARIDDNGEKHIEAQIYDDGENYIVNADFLLEKMFLQSLLSCAFLSEKQMFDYLCKADRRTGDGWAWHISDIKIYDEPRELREFRKGGFMTEQQWLAALYPNTHCHYEAWAKRYEITRPPKSWMYVEEVKQ